MRGINPIRNVQPGHCGSGAHKSFVKTLAKDFLKILWRSIRCLAICCRRWDFGSVRGAFAQSRQLAAYMWIAPSPQASAASRTASE